MSDPTYRERTLHAALHAFDRAHARRRFMRRAAGSASAVALLALAVLVAWPARHAGYAPSGANGAQGAHGTSDAPGTHGAVTPALMPASGRPLPAFVEIIRSDRELAWELEASGSCEGVGRDGDRVFIVPCVTSES